MPQAPRRHLSYANVMATVAVFISLGGVSYAGLKLQRNSVKAQHIARNAVRTSEIAKGAVGTAEVGNGTLLSEDFRVPPRGVRGSRGDRGPTGPPGARGPAGARGADGANGTTNVIVRLGSSFQAAPGDGTLLQADCTAGERAIGGGASPVPTSFTPDADLGSSFPNPSVTGGIPIAWNVGVRNTGPTGAANISFQSYVICASP